MADPELKTDTHPTTKVDQPEDFTVIVGETEIAVHKEILMSSSNFFKNMFSGGMMGNKTNRVKPEGIDEEVMKKLIVFAYSGDEDVLHENTKQILEGASYLQMPAAVEACTKRLVDSLSPENSMDILSTFSSLSLESAVKTVKGYIKCHVTAIKEQCSVKLMPLEAIEVIIAYWDGAEMAAFQFIESWIDVDLNRIKQIKDLMCQVRFSLMTRLEIAKVRRSKIYLYSDELWLELLNRARVYYTLPMHLRVLDNSLQTQVRGDPTPVIFSQLRDQDSVVYHSLDKENKWRAHDMKAAKMPKFSEKTVGIEVNNFYIVYAGHGSGQGWCIFDPRTQTWAKMEGPRTGGLNDCKVVYHDKHLYAIGECDYNDRTRLQRYSFESDWWTAMPSLPVHVRGHAACVVGSTLYVCGGYAGELHAGELQFEEEQEGEKLPLDDDFHSWMVEEHDFFLPSRLYSLDLSSPSPTWTKLRSCPQRLVEHEMCAMKVNNEEVVVAIDEEFEVCVYNPTTTHWSKSGLNFMNSFQDYKAADGRSMFNNGLKFFFMNMFARPNTYDPMQSEDCPHGPQCALWTLTEDGQDAVQHEVEALPFKANRWPDVQIEPFGAMLALPPNVTGTRCSLNTEQTGSN